MNIWKRLFGGSQKPYQPMGPIRVRLGSLKYFELLLPDPALRELLSGTPRPTLMANLFQAINPDYDGIEVVADTTRDCEAVGTPTGKKARRAFIIERMKNQMWRNSELSCVVQFRNVTMQMSAGPTQLPVAICTVFYNDGPKQELIITDDRPLIR